jgi:hypothetical protein
MQSSLREPHILDFFLEISIFPPLLLQFYLLFSFYQFMLLESPALEQRMVEFMLSLAPQFSKTVMAQLPQKRSVVSMPKILGQELSTKLVRNLDNEGWLIGNPGDEAAITDVLQHGMELYDEARCLHPPLRTAAEHSQLD